MRLYIRCIIFVVDWGPKEGSNTLNVIHSWKWFLCTSLLLVLVDCCNMKYNIWLIVAPSHCVHLLNLKDSFIYGSCSLNIFARFVHLTCEQYLHEWRKNTRWCHPTSIPCVMYLHVFNPIPVCKFHFFNYVICSGPI